MIKSAVFDIGGTLMEYKGMPGVWVDYYENGFLHVCEKLLPQLTEKNIADGMPNPNSSDWKVPQS